MLHNKSSSSYNRKRTNCNNLKNKIQTFMKTMRVTVTTNGKSNGIWCLTRLGSLYIQRWSQRLLGLQSHTAFARSTQVINDQPHKIRRVGMHIIQTWMPKQIFFISSSSLSVYISFLNPTHYVNTKWIDNNNSHFHIDKLISL